MEYAGYVQRNQPTDWSKVTGQVAQQIGAVEEKREAKREKLDTMLSDTTAMMGDIEMGESPEFNEVVLDTTDRGRARIYDAYKQMRAGEITPSQFTRIQGNIQARWGEFDTAVKQKNNRLAMIEKRTQEGTNSEMEFWMNEQIAEMNNFSNHRMDWDEDGNLSYIQIDPKTGETIEGSGVPVSAINKTQNVLVDKLNIATEVNKSTKLLAPFKDEIDGYSISGIKIPQYEKTRETIMGSVLGTDPNNYAKALLDNTAEGYFLYKEGDTIPPGKEDLAIKMVMKGNQWIAEPNPTQEGKAKDLVRQAIDNQVGYTRASATGAAGGIYTSKEKTEFQTAYELANDWAIGENLNQLVGSKVGKSIVLSDPPPEDREEGVVVYVTAKDEKTKEEYAKPVLLGKDPKSLIKFGKYTTAVDAAVAYEQGEGAYQSSTGNVYQGKREKKEVEEIDYVDTSSADWKKRAEGYTAMLEKNADDKKIQEEIKDFVNEEVENILSNAYLGEGAFKKLDIVFGTSGSEDIMSIKGPDGKTINIEVDFDNLFGEGMLFGEAFGQKTPQELNKIFTDIANQFVNKYNEGVKNTSQGGASKFNKP